MELTNFAKPTYRVISRIAFKVYNDLLAHQINENSVGLVCELTEDAAQRLFPRYPEISNETLKEAVAELTSRGVFESKGAGLFLYVPWKYEVIEKIV